jgi:cytochrome b subunit of formate dehydrogenase
MGRPDPTDPTAPDAPTAPMVPTGPARPTGPATSGDTGGSVRRYSRPTRWYHTAFYATTLVLLGTGWWLLRGHEGQRSVLSKLLDLPDVEIHRRAGWVLAALAAVGITLGVRAAWTFVRETVRVDRGDGRWFVRWPIGVLTGRFGGHEGHFDPGQRVANVVFVGSLGTLIGSGIALTTLQGGDTFALMVKVHRYSTYVLTVMVVGHVLVALGILPGYRGVWRAMHLGGRVPLATARRLGPATVPHPDPDPAADPAADRGEDADTDPAEEGRSRDPGWPTGWR